MPPLKANAVHHPAEVPATEVDKWVEQAIMLRDRIAEIEAQFELKIKPFKDAQNRVHGTLQQFLDATGQTSAKTEKGTVSIKVTYSAPLGDADIFMNYVMKNGAFELLERRASSTACRDFAEEHGTPPPGVNLNSRRSVTVRRPNER
jgi:hypothetical protein